MEILGVCNYLQMVSHLACVEVLDVVDNYLEPGCL